MVSEQQILTVNTGGFSLRLALFDWDSEQQCADKYLDWSEKSGAQVHSHVEAFDKLCTELDLSAVKAIGHRVVHGGDKFSRSVRLDQTVIDALKELNEIAPLHNPPALELIKKSQEKLGHVPHVAAFDTTFHRALPPTACTYPLPFTWSSEWHVRRYGFHGLNLAYCTERAAEMLNKPTDQTRLVICHLGSGCSITAIEGGRSVATTMGFTPLEGIMMASRSGSVDPGLLLYLMRQKHIAVEKMEEILNSESGLKGVSGVSADLRDVMVARANGNERAKLAFDLYNSRLCEGIGMMLTHVGPIDALVFTDGVGEHVAEVRSAAVQPLQWLGIVLDETLNASAKADCDVAHPYSTVRVFVIHNREELIIQRETKRVLERS